MKALFNAICAYAREQRWFSIGGCRGILGSVRSLPEKIWPRDAGKSKRIFTLVSFCIGSIPVLLAFLRNISQVYEDQNHKKLFSIHK